MVLPDGIPLHNGCSDRYAGVQCSNCARGYYEQRGKFCAPCDPQLKNYMTVVLVVFIALFHVAVFFVHYDIVCSIFDIIQVRVCVCACVRSCRAASDTVRRPPHTAVP